MVSIIENIEMEMGTVNIRFDEMIKVLAAGFVSNLGSNKK